VNAYEALKHGDSEALKGVDLPKDRPVVTVCNLGRTSLIAAEQLRERGLDAFTLAGGMKAWSLAWNTAEIELEKSKVWQVRRTGKGCLSYLVGSASEAVVVDSSLDAAVYVRLAAEHGWAIRYVLDTHMHSDHLSRSRALAESTGARLLLPAQGWHCFAFTPIEDGQTIGFGDSRLTAIASPGHTMESACYYLDRHALFTGDTLFISGVGCPDLHASVDETRQRARLLYRSLQRLFALPAHTLVLPGHTSEPPAFDRTPIAEGLDSISATLASWLHSEENFVAAIVNRIPPTPPNYLRIAELNQNGATPEGDVTDLEAGANRCAIS